MDNVMHQIRRPVATFLGAALVSATLAVIPALAQDQTADSQTQSDTTGDRHGKHKKKDADVLPGADQHSAPCISWEDPLVKPRMALLCIHGLGLYSGSYNTFGMRMARHGVATYAVDVRGFGSWMKAQGHAEIDFKDCLEDVHTALISIRKANPGLPVYLLGESMGGAIALRAASMYPDLIDGLISSVPSGERFQQKKTDLKVALEFLKGPNKQFDIGNKIVDQATKNDKLRKDWSSDPLDRMDLSAKELMQFQKFMNENHDAAKLVKTIPVLFMQGTEDKLVKPEGTWELFNEVATDRKYFMAVPSEHLIYEEGQDHTLKFAAEVSNMTSTWMQMMASNTLPTHVAARNNVINPNVIDAADPDVAQAVQLIMSNHPQDAAKILETVTAKKPDDAEAHYWLGMSYARMHEPLKARLEMTKALALGHGSLQSQQANNFLIANGGESEESPAQPQTNVAVKQVTDGSPTVVAFYASWCEQCEPIDKFFAQARSMFGDKVKLLKVDVEDKTKSDLVKTFSVGPVPTVVFLDRDGSIASTSIGRTSFINFAKGISTIIK